MKPVLQTMSDRGAGHVQHMENLYGKEDEEAGANATDLQKVNSLG